MIAQELEVSLHMAFVEARQARHEFITVEHLLMALLDNPSAAEVMRACACNIEDLRKSLQNFIADNTPILPPNSEADTQPTLGFQRVIQRAIMHVQSTSNGKKEVTGANVLVAIFGEKDSHAVYYLHQQGVTRLDVVNFISHGITKAPQEGEKPAKPAAAEQEEQQGEGRDQQSPLDQYTMNLNQLAKDGKIDPLIGREPEVERVMDISARLVVNQASLKLKREPVRALIEAFCQPVGGLKAVGEELLFRGVAGLPRDGGVVGAVDQHARQHVGIELHLPAVGAGPHEHVWHDRLDH